MNSYSDFTDRILKEIIRENDRGNILISPFSIISVLAMGAHAAAGISRDEIVTAALPCGSYDDLTALVKEELSRISCESEVSSSNATIVKAELQNNIVEGYAEGLKNLMNGDLLISNNLPKTANEWATEKTEGMIQHVMDEDDIMTLACLINAILFKAEWLDEYEDSDIDEDGEFTNLDGSTANVHMMCSEEDKYIENEYFTGFTKPYKGSFSYMALLPKKQSRTFMRSALMESNLTKLYESRENKDVTVEIPEYSCEFNTELNDVCERLGMKSVFTDMADFTNMCTKALKIGKIIRICNYA